MAVWAVLCGAVLLVSLLWLRKVRKIDNKTIIMAAMCTAAAFAVFQVSIPIFGGVHLNLTPLIGILAGRYRHGLLAGNIVMICIIVISGVQGAAPGIGEQFPGLIQGTIAISDIFSNAITLSLNFAPIAAINMGVPILEAIITGYIVSYIMKIRPDMLGEANNAAGN